MGTRPWSAKETTAQLQAIINAHNNLHMEHKKLEKRFKISVVAGIVVYCVTLGFLLL